MSQDKGGHHDHMKKQHQKAQDTVVRLKQLEHQVNQAKFPPSTKAEAEHLDSLLSQMQGLHQELQDDIAGVRESLKPLLVS